MLRATPAGLNTGGLRVACCCRQKTNGIATSVKMPEPAGTRGSCHPVEDTFQRSSRSSSHSSTSHPKLSASSPTPRLDPVSISFGVQPELLDSHGRLRRFTLRLVNKERVSTPSPEEPTYPLLQIHRGSSPCRLAPAHRLLCSFFLLNFRLLSHLSIIHDRSVRRVFDRIAPAVDRCSSGYPRPVACRVFGLTLGNYDNLITKPSLPLHVHPVMPCVRWNQTWRSKRGGDRRISYTITPAHPVVLYAFPGLLFSINPYLCHLASANTCIRSYSYHKVTQVSLFYPFPTHRLLPNNCERHVPFPTPRLISGKIQRTIASFLAITLLGNPCYLISGASPFFPANYLISMTGTPPPTMTSADFHSSQELHHLPAPIPDPVTGRLDPNDPTVKALTEAALNMDKSKIPRPYKCPLCDRAFYRLEHQVSSLKPYAV